LLRKNKILNFLKNIVKTFKYLKSYIYDIRKYLKYSTTLRKYYDFDTLESRIIAHYHVIEKGLSLKNTRFGYGKDIIYNLLDLLQSYKEIGYHKDHKTYKTAISVLKSYIEFHENNNYDIKELKSTINKVVDTNIKSDELGGVKSFKKEEIIKKTNQKFDLFANSRFSIRNFTSEEVEIADLKDAVRIAQKSPSVCNRQSSKVYIIDNEELKEKILKMQNGNRGFGHLANKIIIVTSNLKAFNGIGERNQSYIDGGMFGMSLLYALHYKGLGTCAVNWAVNSNQDKKIRKELNINLSENILFMVLVGHIPNMFSVAKSTRKNMSDILKVCK
jgi:nitroreductase